MQKLLTLIAVGALLCACGENDSETGESSAQAQQSKANVKIQASGDASLDIAGRGSFYCTADSLTGAPGFEMYLRQEGTSFNMRWPAALTPGKHQLDGANGEQFSVSLTPDTRARNYSALQSGTLTISDQPKTQSQSFVGVLKARLKDGQGHQIEVNIDMDVPAGSQTFDECPELAGS